MLAPWLWGWLEESDPSKEGGTPRSPIFFPVTEAAHPWGQRPGLVGRERSTERFRGARPTPGGQQGSAVLV